MKPRDLVVAVVRRRRKVRPIVATTGTIAHKYTTVACLKFSDDDGHRVADVWMPWPAIVALAAVVDDLGDNP